MCDYEATTKGSLRKHIVSIHLGVKHNCPLCGLPKSDVKNHIKSVHEEETEYNCIICKAEFKSMSSLMDHTNRIHKGRTYKCPHCEKQFLHQSYLPTHIASVHNKQKFKCDHCEKVFSSASNKYIHIKSVHQQKKYGCKRCESEFSSNDALKKHD